MPRTSPPSPPQASSTTFWSKALDPAFDGPEVSGEVVVFEAPPANASAGALAWPFISRGAPTERRSARQWALGEGDAPKLVAALTGYYGVDEGLFGPPGTRARRAAALQTPCRAGHAVLFAGASRLCPGR